MIDEIRKRLQEKNVVLPMVHFSDNELLDDGDYMICSKGKLLKQGHQDPDGKTIDKISKELYDLFIETEMR